MKFNGCNPFSPEKPTIEISYSGKVWDLHNDAEFLGFSYIVKAKAISLKWRYYYEAEGGLLNEVITLEFLDVAEFEVKSRDRAMPYSEDDCLSEMIYFADKNIFVLKFQGGQELRVSSEEMSWKKGHITFE